MVNMALFTSVSGCGMALLECSVMAQIKTVRADTNRLFIQAGIRAALPGKRLPHRSNRPGDTVGPASCNALTPSSLQSTSKSTKAIKLTVWRRAGVLPVVEPVAYQLPRCVDASPLADPLSESTLLAVGPCGWLTANATASVAFWDDSISVTSPARAVKQR